VLESTLSGKRQAARKQGLRDTMPENNPKKEGGIR
jgi:hypothetical protein